jgi:hypothetical protein
VDIVPPYYRQGNGIPSTAILIDIVGDGEPRLKPEPEGRYGSGCDVQGPSALRLVRGDKQTLSPYPQGGYAICSVRSYFPQLLG